MRAASRARESHCCFSDEGGTGWGSPASPQTTPTCHLPGHTSCSIRRNQPDLQEASAALAVWQVHAFTLSLGAQLQAELMAERSWAQNWSSHRSSINDEAGWRYINEMIAQAHLFSHLTVLSHSFIFFVLYPQPLLRVLNLEVGVWWSRVGRGGVVISPPECLELRFLFF